jgi:AcrR family transcriptional regulator
MNEIPNFQRARKPEEIEARREKLLAAAAELFDAEGPMGAGLNAIAAKAGFTKSNVYRYFESREQVLLELFLAALAEFTADVVAQVEEASVGDVEALARITTAGFTTRPRLGHLSAILSTTLEANVSEETILRVKGTMGALMGQIAVALQRRLPRASVEDCGWAITVIGSLIAGMWPGAHPTPTAERVLSRPDLAHMRLNIERDVPRAARAILASIA